MRRSLVLATPFLLAIPTWSQEGTVPADRLTAVEAELAELRKLVEQGSGPGAMRTTWKDGLRFESIDKRYKFRVGGRIHYDLGFFHEDEDTSDAVEVGAVRIEDGSEFRRARIEMSGEVADRIDWAGSYDFAGGSPNFRNVYMGVKDLPPGDIRVGQFKEPYGLEQLTSANTILFMERSLMNTFVPAFNAGAMLFDRTKSERMTWAVGAFRTGTDNGEVSKGDGEWSATTRLTGLPHWNDEGTSYVHTGLDVSLRNPLEDQVTFSAKPEANLAPAYVQVTNLPADDYLLLGLEAAWTDGPFTLSGEHTWTKVDGNMSAPDADFSGWYAQASWFLTGESRPYRRSQGCFDVIKPVRNAFGADGGHGAWELAIRRSGIDLRDGTVDGGQLHNTSIGVNWYLNPNTRTMMNYIIADLDPAGGADDGETDILEFRFLFFF